MTLGHKFLLLELDSPLLTGDPCSFGDILLAVFVFAQPHTSARKLVRRRWFLSMFFWYWGWRCRFCDLQSEIERLKAYIRDEQAMPPLADPGMGQGRSIGTPRDILLLDFLLSYKHGEGWALDYPIRSANALWVARWESEGRIELATASGSIASIIKALWQRRRELAGQEANN